MELDLIFFVKSLKNIYLNHGGLENIFKPNQMSENMAEVIHQMKKYFSLFLTKIELKNMFQILLKAQLQKELICS